MLLLRILASMGFATSGVLHLVRPEIFLRIVPPMLPAPGMLVFVSGVAEIAGAIGLWVPPLQRAAGIGLIALLIAVFPANIYMAVAHDKFAQFPQWALWARLPLQGVFIWAVWRAAGLRGS